MTNYLGSTQSEITGRYRELIKKAEDEETETKDK
jgi:hypothetical protein